MVMSKARRKWALRIPRLVKTLESERQKLHMENVKKDPLYQRINSILNSGALIKFENNFSYVSLECERIKFLNGNMAQERYHQLSQLSDEGIKLRIYLETKYGMEKKND